MSNNFSTSSSNSTLLKRRVTYDWQSLRQIVNAHVIGKAYGAYYIRDVALGYRTNHKIEKILNRLGVMSELRRGAV